MKFVRRCLTKDCFLEVTHLWFLALLVSPIHLAGLYYQRRYRLNYVHAKKLFLLDSLLLVIVIILGISLYSWLTFTPQPEALKLTMTTEATRYRSGDPLTITVAYQNKNSETLRDLQMTVSLPPEFLLSATAPGAAANSSTVIFSLPPVAPTADKKIAITGRLYGTPHQEYPFDAHLFFTADNHKRSEKIIRLILTPRDSTLQIVVENPTAIPADGLFPLKINLINTGDDPIPTLTLPLAIHPLLRLKTSSTTLGRVENDEWTVEKLLAHASTTLVTKFQSSLPIEASTTVGKLVPYFIVNDKKIPQQPVAILFKIVHPAITILTAWRDGAQHAGPGTTPILDVVMKNSGPDPLVNSTLSLKIPDRLLATATAADTIQLRQLLPEKWRQGQSLSIPIALPISKKSLSGRDIVLRPILHFTGHVDGLSDVSYATSVTAPPLMIDTAIQPQASLRYYTSDGEQLGRGAFPPQVGKTTKYWLLLSLRNGTSDAENITARVVLPASVAWTGKKSLSHGRDIISQDNGRTLTITLPYLAAHETATINAELAFTPTALDRGTIATIVESVRITGRDTFTGATLGVNLPPLTTALPDDLIARERGIVIK